MLDFLTAGVGLYAADGTLVHANRTLQRMLAAAPDGHRLRCAASAVVRAASASGAGGDVIADGELLGAAGLYHLRAGRLPPLASHGRAAIVLAIEGVTPRLPSEPLLRARWRLTRQEARVAVLLAEGRSDSEVAEALGVSLDTARHHVARVRRKFGVRSRAEVAARMLGTAPRESIEQEMANSGDSHPRAAM